MAFNTNDISYIDSNGNRITVGTNTPLPVSGGGGGGGGGLTQPTVANPFYDALVYMGAVVSDSNALGVKLLAALPAGSNEIGRVRLMDISGNGLTSQPGSTPIATGDRALAVGLSPNSPLPSGTNNIGIVNIGASGSVSAVKASGVAALTTDNALVVQLSPNSPVGKNTLPTYDKGAYAVTTDDIATSVNAISTNLAATDCVDLQSISIQIIALTAYTGTINIEVSNDGTNWKTKQLIRVADGTIQSGYTGSAEPVGNGQVYQGDIGARYIRLRQAAYTSGQARVIAVVSALSTNSVPTQNITATLAAGTNVAGMVRAVPNHASDQTTSTTLGASATYTSGVTDQGADTTVYASRVRVGVMHTAGLVHGHLVMEQSDDNATYRETDRIPVPSDGYMHNYGFTVVSRYYRTKFINGATAQTVFYHHSFRIGVEGPTPDSSNKTNFPLSTTALGASATFTSPAFDLGNNHGFSTIRALGFADQAGNVRVQQSTDGSSWRDTRPFESGLGSTISGTSVAVAANGNEYADFKIFQRYLRVVFANSTTAQTAMKLDAVLIP
jgi:hypothetical protein